MKLGFWEILVILIVALLVIGPDKLPFYTKKLGVALKEFRKVSEDVTKEVRESVIDPLEEASAPLREAIEPLEELKKDIEGNLTSVEKEFKNIGKPKKSTSAKKDAEMETPEEPQAETAQAEEVPVSAQTEEIAEEQHVSAESVPEAAEVVSAAEDKEPISETEGGVNE